MRLISATDFVLIESKGIKVYKFDVIQIRDYAQFIKQPLTLDMFIGENALFKGFIINEEDYLQFNHAWIISIDELNEGIIEDLIDSDLELTDYALKQLGL